MSTSSYLDRTLAASYDARDVASAYERGRPGYPAAAVTMAVAGLELSASSTVVDLAAGTGKLTQELADVGPLYAVEPAAAMRQIFARRLPEVPCLGGTAEALPFADATLDAIVVGDAFHWFDPQRALPELARVLRPGGGLAVFKHAPAPGEVGTWAADYRTLLARMRAFDPSAVVDAPLDDPRSWRQTLRRAHGFIEVGEATVHQIHAQTVEDFLGQVRSRAFIAALDPEPREQVLTEVATILGAVSEVLTEYDVTVVLLRSGS